MDDVQTVLYTLSAVLVAAYVIRWTSHPVSSLYTRRTIYVDALTNFFVAPLYSDRRRSFCAYSIVYSRVQLQEGREEAHNRGLPTCEYTVLMLIIFH